MNTQTYTSEPVTIIGGGIIGMLTAYVLRRAGCEVSLLERGDVGQESSWAGGGILSPLYPWRYPDPVNALACWSQDHYPDWIGDIRELSGIDPELEPSGMLVLDPDQQPEALDWAARFGREVRALDPAGVHALEPALAADTGAALWLPFVSQVRNPRLVKALRGALSALEVPVREHCEVTACVCDESGGRVTAVATTGGEIPVQLLVVAGGAWTGRLLAATGWSLPIEPVRGQMLLLRAEPGQLRHMVLASGHYLIPRRDGRILAGSTLEYTGFDKTTTPEAEDELLRFATALVPDLARAPVEHHWAGLRPGSPHGIPAIGRHPVLQNLYINTGHFRNGVVMGPASAQLLGDLLLGREPILPPADYDPEKIG